MKAELFSFQKRALRELRMKSAEAIYRYGRTHSNQVISFTAPTGAGKTIIMAALIESIFFGDEECLFSEKPETIIVWLSDSPELNEQSKDKIDLKADKIRLGQCVTVKDDSFDQEMFDDGHIYFLNTQKLGKSSNLTKHTDNRQYTIWETLANTAREKSDRLYFIIDEAHRGMKGSEAGKATTIMQKFLKGSPEDGIEAMPVVIGMSATSARFNTLVQGIASDTQYVVVTTEEVRSSGLLKDRIVISYPEKNSGDKDMAVLQAAADEWKNKWDHWYQYCYELHRAHVNPILVIQVENAASSAISKTGLDDCLQNIEEKTGIRFEEGEVVHTFVDANNVTVNGLNVPYVAPSEIAGDKRIRIVFFKESLSTGWDCPRAETMMSFRHATDATYIAQLLGRMIRTPLQMRIMADETLNDVHLYLPYFNSETVKEVVGELQNAEGGNIPADIQKEELGSDKPYFWSIRPNTTSGGIKQRSLSPDQRSLFDNSGDNKPSTGNDGAINTGAIPAGNTYAQSSVPTVQEQHDGKVPKTDPGQTTLIDTGNPYAATATTAQEGSEKSDATFIGNIDREGVVKAINDLGLLTYDIRKVRVNDNYLLSLYSLARLLVQSGKYPEAKENVFDKIMDMIRENVADLKRRGVYDEMSRNIREFKMNNLFCDPFGKKVERENEDITQYSMSSTDREIDGIFRKAETKLGKEGVGNKYVERYCDVDDPSIYKIDVILYASDDECYKKLLSYAESAFHDMNDQYRRKIAGLDEKFTKQYDRIISDGDTVSKHNFRLPEIIQPYDVNSGKIYYDHLFVDDSGKARIDLNGWEDAVIAEERARNDYVCWLRNTSRAKWSLCIPYEMKGEKKASYPDFLIVRKDSDGKYVVDILEPHNPNMIDNIYKARGFAEYAKQNLSVGRIQLIRVGKDAIGKKRFMRLDMAKSAVREEVLRARTNEELDHIFEKDGFFMDA